MEIAICLMPCVEGSKGPGNVGVGTVGGTTLPLTEDSTVAPDQARCFFFVMGKQHGDAKSRGCRLTLESVALCPDYPLYAHILTPPGKIWDY